MQLPRYETSRATTIPAEAADSHGRLPESALCLVRPEAFNAPDDFHDTLGLSLAVLPAFILHMNGSRPRVSFAEILVGVPAVRPSRYLPAVRDFRFCTCGPTMLQVTGGAINQKGGETEAEALQSMRPPGAERSRNGARRAGRKDDREIGQQGATG